MAPEGAHTSTAAEDDGDTDCMICFETLDSRGGAVPLPCDCRVAYCHHCWDRALAASISACGRALCPSCRSWMHVDFDAAGGRLLFSRLQGGSGEDGEEPQDDWRKRLYAKAKPLQIALLQRYGAQATASADAIAAADSSRAASAAQARGTDAIEVQEQEEGPSAGVASTRADPPRCVCGHRLTCTSARERVLAFISEAPMPTPPTLLEHLMQRPPIVCDICTRQVPPRSRVWTCENGRRTVLHAVRYDVCEACFAFHSFGIEIPSDTGEGAGDEGEGSLEDGDASSEEDKDDW